MAFGISAWLNSILVSKAAIACFLTPQISPKYTVALIPQSLNFDQFEVGFVRFLLPHDEYHNLPIRKKFQPNHPLFRTVIN